MALSDEWYNRLRSCVVSGVEYLPEVGGAAGKLLEFLWPARETNVFEVVKEDTQRLVDRAVLLRFYQERDEQLKGWFHTLRRYHEARPQGPGQATGTTSEQGSFMISLIQGADPIVEHLLGVDGKHLLVLAVPFAIAHLTVLRERVQHGRELFIHDNSKEWLQELVDQYDTYFAYFSKSFEAWKLWRSDQISAESGTEGWFPPLRTPWMRVKDLQIPGKEIYKDSVRDSGRGPNYDTFPELKLAFKKQWLSESVAEMACALSPTFIMHQLLPGREIEGPKWGPAFATITMGPFAWCLDFQARKNARAEITGPDCSNADAHLGAGRLTKVAMRVRRKVDHLQLTYEHRQGNMACTMDDGGQERIIELRNKYITGVGLQFGGGNDIIASMRLFFDDGSDTGILGNCEHWEGPAPVAKMNRSWELATWGWDETSTGGYGGLEGLFKMEFVFAPSNSFQAMWIPSCYEHYASADQLEPGGGLAWENCNNVLDLCPPIPGTKSSRVIRWNFIGSQYMLQNSFKGLAPGNYQAMYRIKLASAYRPSFQLISTTSDGQPWGMRKVLLSGEIKQLAESQDSDGWFVITGGVFPSSTHTVSLQIWQSPPESQPDDPPSFLEAPHICYIDGVVLRNA